MLTCAFCPVSQLYGKSVSSSSHWKKFWTNSVKDKSGVPNYVFFSGSSLKHNQQFNHVKMRKEGRKRPLSSEAISAPKLMHLYLTASSLSSWAGLLAYFSHSSNWLSYSVSQPTTVQKQRTNKRQVLTMTKVTGDRLEKEAENLRQE